jgi:hypothetical protein
MTFGQLAGNSSINSLIYASLECIHPDDVMTFVRKFGSEKGAQLYHTLHELTMGAELWRRGVPMRYERQIEGKTPDWSLHDQAGEVTEILDVTALHQRHTIEADMLHTLSRGEIWSGWISFPPDHIYSKIEQKAGPYANLVGSLGIPYVIGLFGEFTASIDPEELHCVLFLHHGGLFRRASDRFGSTVLLRGERDPQLHTLRQSPCAICITRRGTCVQWQRGLTRRCSGQNKLSRVLLAQNARQFSLPLSFIVRPHV